MKFYPSRWLAAILFGLIAFSAHAFSLTDTEGKSAQTGGLQRQMGAGEFLGYLVPAVSGGNT